MCVININHVTADILPGICTRFMIQLYVLYASFIISIQSSLLAQVLQVAL